MREIGEAAQAGAYDGREEEVLEKAVIIFDASLKNLHKRVAVSEQHEEEVQVAPPVSDGQAADLARRESEPKRPLIDLSDLPVDHFVGRERQIVMELIRNSEQGILRTVREVGIEVYRDDIEKGRKTPSDAATTTSAAITGAIERKLPDMGFIVVKEEPKTHEGKRLPNRFGIARKEVLQASPPTPREDGEADAAKPLSGVIASEDEQTVGDGAEARAEALRETSDGGVGEHAFDVTGGAVGGRRLEVAAEAFAARQDADEEVARLLQEPLPHERVQIEESHVSAPGGTPATPRESSGMLDITDFNDASVSRVLRGWDEFRLRRVLSELPHNEGDLVPENIVPRKIKEVLRFDASGIIDSFLSYDTDLLDSITCGQLRDDIGAALRYIDAHPQAGNLLEVTQNAQRQFAELSGKKISKS